MPWSQGGFLDLVYPMESEIRYHGDGHVAVICYQHRGQASGEFQDMLMKPGVPCAVPCGGNTTACSHLLSVLGNSPDVTGHAAVLTPAQKKTCQGFTHWRSKNLSLWGAEQCFRGACGFPLLLLVAGACWEQSCLAVKAVCLLILWGNGLANQGLVYT